MKTINQTYTNLQQIINIEGKENLRFLVPMRPLRNAFLFKYTSSSDEEQMVLCRIIEERYKLKDNYKIELKAEDSERFGKQSFYIRDLEQLITNKTIRIFTELTESEG